MKKNYLTTSNTEMQDFTANIADKFLIKSNKQYFCHQSIMGEMHLIHK